MLDKMKVLFVCRSNKGRSQVAAGFFAAHSKHDAESAGTHAKSEGIEGEPASGRQIEAMKEIGYDISKARVRQLTKEMADEADIIIVTFSAYERRRYLPDYLKHNSKVRVWDVRDMRHVHDPEVLRARREQIKGMVSGLVKELG